MLLIQDPGAAQHQALLDISLLRDYDRHTHLHRMSRMLSVLTPLVRKE
jgi:hypothetical protein